MRSQRGDAKGFKQLVTLAVSPSCVGPCPGLVIYQLSWRDKNGATQTSSGKTARYNFIPGQGGGVSSGGGTCVTDDMVLEAGASVTEVSCFRDGGVR